MTRNEEDSIRLFEVPMSKTYRLHCHQIGIATSRIIASHNFSPRYNRSYHPSFYAEFTKLLNVHLTAWSGLMDADTS